MLINIFLYKKNDKIQEFQIFSKQNQSIKELIEEVLKSNQINWNLYKQSYHIQTSPIDQKMESKLKFRKGFNDLFVQDFLLKSQTIHIFLIEQKKLNYLPLMKYSFYNSSDKYAIVRVFLEGVEKINQNQIKCSFERREIQLKVENQNNKNYIFGVPRLHYPIDPQGSSFKVKKDYIILKLRKVNQKDQFDILHKQKMIGDDSDEDNQFSQQ